MQAPQQVKADLVGHESIHSTNDCHPDGAADEDELFAKDICNATPYKEKAAKGESIGGDNPLQPRFRDVD